LSTWRVRENYAPNGDRDPHHWYGFLTSPEFIDIACKFWMRTRVAGADARVAPAAEIALRDLVEASKKVWQGRLAYRAQARLITEPPGA
jgi:hypothetical protein